MLDSTERLSRLFADNPLAVFVALLVLAVIALFMTNMRTAGKLNEEQREHLATAREVSTLTVQMRQVWDEQLKQNDRSQHLQERTLGALEKSLALLEARRA